MLQKFVYWTGALDFLVGFAAMGGAIANPQPAQFVPVMTLGAFLMMAAASVFGLFASLHVADDLIAAVYQVENTRKYVPTLKADVVQRLNSVAEQDSRQRQAFDVFLTGVNASILLTNSARSHLSLLRSGHSLFLVSGTHT